MNGKMYGRRSHVIYMYHHSPRLAYVSCGIISNPHQTNPIVSVPFHPNVVQQSKHALQTPCSNTTESEKRLCASGNVVLVLNRDALRLSQS
jgi:hypothetical protein